MSDDNYSDETADHGDADAELSILRLAALAVDLRRSLSPDLLETLPGLATALTALDELFRDRYQSDGVTDDG